MAMREIMYRDALREAIEPDPADPKILQTVRGTGYVLRADAP